MLDFYNGDAIIVLVTMGIQIPPLQRLAGP
ncbi:hypothetical protein ROS217_03780 [Roseovarius sp. 217]|nr:hypothetical protein ROS217_03780 [Roseovarius sp. 217]